MHRFVFFRLGAQSREGGLASGRSGARVGRGERGRQGERVVGDGTKAAADWAAGRRLPPVAGGCC